MAKKKAKAKGKRKSGLTQTTYMLSEELAAVEPGNALGFFFSGKAKLDALNLQLAQHRTYQTAFQTEGIRGQQRPAGDHPGLQRADRNRLAVATQVKGAAAHPQAALAVKHV